MLIDEKDPTRITNTDEFRVSHPHVFRPSQYKKTDKPRYSIEMLFDKNFTKLSDLQKPLAAAAKKKWGAKENWPTKLQYPYRDGDKPFKGKVLPEHKGMWIVRASSLAEFGAPPVVGKDPKIPLTSQADFYPGCYARAALKAGVYEGNPDGVKFYLDAVQKTRDGKALGGKRPADQVFGIIEDDEAPEGVEENFDDMPDEDDIAL